MVFLPFPSKLLRKSTPGCIYMLAPPQLISGVHVETVMWELIVLRGESRLDSCSSQRSFRSCTTPEEARVLMTVHFPQWETLFSGYQSEETPGLRLITGGTCNNPAVMVHFYALWMWTIIQFSHAAIYTNDWAIRIRADNESVNRIAEKYGFTNMGQVSSGENFLLFYMYHPSQVCWSMEEPFCPNV